MSKRLGRIARHVAPQPCALDEKGNVVPCDCHLQGEPAESIPTSLEERIRSLTTRSPVILFMKGTPSVPRCKWSRACVQTLQSQGVEFDSFDILGDEEVRQGLKTFSGQASFPQLFAAGKLIGGNDAINALVAKGMFLAEVGQIDTIP